jgi:outer membrane protein assembly factor BamB
MRIHYFVLGLSIVLRAADADWPQWRGPANDGVARTTPPLTWSDTSNIAWKIKVPGKGHSSPVIWGNRIFLTTAIATAASPETAPAAPQGRGGPGGGAGPLVEHKFDVICYDRATGKVLWQRTAATATPHEGYHGRYGSFASNTPVTDGKMVYAFFGSRGAYAYDLNGNLKWKKDFGVPMRMRNSFGEGVAPALYENMLILTFDQEANSFAVALDKTTGSEKWRVSREERSSWAQPLGLMHEGRKQVVISATNKVRSYELESGNLIWEAAGLGANVIPAPVLFNGTVIVMSGYRDPNLLAIKLGKTGDLTGTDSILWTNQRGNSYTASPVLHDGKLYFVTDNGMLSCLDAATGKPYYQQQRLPKAYNFKSSPVAAAGRLYLSTEDEDVVAVKLGEQFEVLATNTLKDQSFIATPAVAGNEIYLRSQSTLFCIRQ